jgi:hypothetical protein
VAAARFTDTDTSVEDTRPAVKWQVAFARSRSLSRRRVSPTASAVAAQSVPPGPVGAAACATEREATRAGEMRRRPRRRVRAVHGEATAGSPSSSSGLWASGSTRGLPSCRSRRSDGSLSATAHARQVATWSSPSDFSGFHRRATRLEVGGSDEGIRGAARRASSSCFAPIHPGSADGARASVARVVPRLGTLLSHCAGDGRGCPSLRGRRAVYIRSCRGGSWMDGAIAACTPRPWRGDVGRPALHLLAI